MEILHRRRAPDPDERIHAAYLGSTHLNLERMSMRMSKRKKKGTKPNDMKTYVSLQTRIYIWKEIPLDEGKTKKKDVLMESKTSASQECL